MKECVTIFSRRGVSLHLPNSRCHCLSAPLVLLEYTFQIKQHTSAFVFSSWLNIRPDKPLKMDGPDQADTFSVS